MLKATLGSLFSSVALAALALSPSASAQTPIKTVLFKNGLSNPIFATAPANDFDHLYVVERAGRIKVLDINNGNVLSTFLDISALTTLTGERGLLSMAFHPQYDINGSNKDFYLYYTNSAGNIVIARYAASTALAANPAGSILLTINHPGQSNHNGGQVAFGADGYLYFATGDGGGANDTPNNAQTLSSYLGKMHRISPVVGTGTYTIPTTNPFFGGTGIQEMIARGLRNPFRFSFDRNTGDLYIADVGQGAWEEIDFQAGTFTPAPNSPRNYAWRCLEGTHATNLSGCVYPNPYPNIVPPIYEYSHSSGNCIIGGFVYRGAAIPDLRGTYFFADNGSNKIWSLKYNGVAVSNFTDRTASLAPGGGLSITSIPGFGQDAMGEMYICDLGSEIYKVVPVTPVNVGLANYGVGTPGCSGPQVMSANSNPVINHPGFKLRTTNCPPNSLGLAIVTDIADVPGGDPFFLSVLLHVGVGGQFITFDAVSDNLGAGQASAPIPNDPLLASLTFYATTLWGWDTGICTLPPVNFFNLSTSDGLSIVPQP